MADQGPSDDQIHGDEDYVAEQEAEAAREAALVGGDPGDDYGVEESERALAEAGQGEAEGFELAEQELIENASHEADANPDPTHLQGVPERFDPGEDTYGDADDVEPDDL